MSNYNQNPQQWNLNPQNPPPSSIPQHITGPFENNTIPQNPQIPPFNYQPQYNHPGAFPHAANQQYQPGLYNAYMHQQHQAHGAPQLPPQSLFHDQQRSMPQQQASVANPIYGQQQYPYPNVGPSQPEPVAREPVDRSIEDEGHDANQDMDMVTKMLAKVNKILERNNAGGRVQVQPTGNPEPSIPPDGPSRLGFSTSGPRLMGSGHILDRPGTSHDPATASPQQQSSTSFMAADLLQQTRVQEHRAQQSAGQPQDLSDTGEEDRVARLMNTIRGMSSRNNSVPASGSRSLSASVDKATADPRARPNRTDPAEDDDEEEEDSVMQQLPQVFRKLLKRKMKDMEQNRASASPSVSPALPPEPVAADQPPPPPESAPEQTNSQESSANDLEDLLKEIMEHGTEAPTSAAAVPREGTSVTHGDARDRHSKKDKSKQKSSGQQPAEPQRKSTDRHSREHSSSTTERTTREKTLPKLTQDKAAEKKKQKRREELAAAVPPDLHRSGRQPRPTAPVRPQRHEGSSTSDRESRGTTDERLARRATPASSSVTGRVADRGRTSRSPNSQRRFQAITASKHRSRSRSKSPQHKRSRRRSPSPLLRSSRTHLGDAANTYRSSRPHDSHRHRDRSPSPRSLVAEVIGSRGDPATSVSPARRGGSHRRRTRSPRRSRSPERRRADSRRQSRSRDTVQAASRGRSRSRSPRRQRDASSPRPRHRPSPSGEKSRSAQDRSSSGTTAAAAPTSSLSTHHFDKDKYFPPNMTFIRGAPDVPLSNFYRLTGELTIDGKTYGGLLSYYYSQQFAQTGFSSYSTKCAHERNQKAVYDIKNEFKASHKNVLMDLRAWRTKNGLKYMLAGLHAKFSKDETARAALLNNKTSIIISSKGTLPAFWSVGMSTSDFKSYVHSKKFTEDQLRALFQAENPARDPKKIGQNHLGLLLMQVRQELLDDPAPAAPRPPIPSLLTGLAPAQPSKRSSWPDSEYAKKLSGIRIITSELDPLSVWFERQNQIKISNVYYRSVAHYVYSVAFADLKLPKIATACASVTFEASDPAPRSTAKTLRVFATKVLHCLQPKEVVAVTSVDDLDVIPTDIDEQYSAWLQVRRGVVTELMVKGLTSKLSRNKALKKVLLDTGSDMIVDAVGQTAGDDMDETLDNLGVGMSAADFVNYVSDNKISNENLLKAFSSGGGDIGNVTLGPNTTGSLLMCLRQRLTAASSSSSTGQPSVTPASLSPSSDSGTTTAVNVKNEPIEQSATAEPPVTNGEQAPSPASAAVTPEGPPGDVNVPSLPPPEPPGFNYIPCHGSLITFSPNSACPLSNGYPTGFKLTVPVTQQPPASEEGQPDGEPVREEKMYTSVWGYYYNRMFYDLGLPDIAETLRLITDASLVYKLAEALLTGDSDTVAAIDAEVQVLAPEIADMIPSVTELPGDLAEKSWEWCAQSSATTMLAGLMGKFKADTRALWSLASTGVAILVYCSPGDSLFGINMEAAEFTSQAAAADVDGAQVTALASGGTIGSNLLGIQLMQVRYELQTLIDEESRQEMQPDAETHEADQLCTTFAFVEQHLTAALLPTDDADVQAVLDKKLACLCQRELILKQDYDLLAVDAMDVHLWDRVRLTHPFGKPPHRGDCGDSLESVASQEAVKEDDDAPFENSYLAPRICELQTQIEQSSLNVERDVEPTAVASLSYHEVLFVERCPRCRVDLNEFEFKGFAILDEAILLHPWVFDGCEYRGIWAPFFLTYVSEVVSRNDERKKTANTPREAASLTPSEVKIAKYFNENDPCGSIPRPKESSPETSTSSIVTPTRTLTDIRNFFQEKLPNFRRPFTQKSDWYDTRGRDLFWNLLRAYIYDCSTARSLLLRTANSSVPEDSDASSASVSSVIVLADVTGPLGAGKSREEVKTKLQPPSTTLSAQKAREEQVKAAKDLFAERSNEAGQMLSRIRDALITSCSSELKELLSRQTNTNQISLDGAMINAEAMVEEEKKPVSTADDNTTEDMVIVELAPKSGNMPGVGAAAPVEIDCPIVPAAIDEHVELLDASSNLSGTNVEGIVLYGHKITRVFPSIIHCYMFYFFQKFNFALIHRELQENFLTPNELVMAVATLLGLVRKSCGLSLSWEEVKNRIDAWMLTEGLDIMKQILRRSVEMNASERQHLLSTYPKYILELGLTDRFWGAGMSKTEFLHHARVNKLEVPTLKLACEEQRLPSLEGPHYKIGQNFMGRIMMEIRDEIREKDFVSERCLFAANLSMPNGSRAVVPEDLEAWLPDAVMISAKDSIVEKAATLRNDLAALAQEDLPTRMSRLNRSAPLGFDIIAPNVTPLSRRREQSEILCTSGPAARVQMVVDDKNTPKQQPAPQAIPDTAPEEAAPTAAAAPASDPTGDTSYIDLISKANDIGLSVITPSRPDLCVIDGTDLFVGRPVTYADTAHASLIHCFYETLLGHLGKDASFIKQLALPSSPQQQLELIVKTFDETARATFNDTIIHKAAAWVDREGRILLERCILSMLRSDDALWGRLESTKGKLIVDLSVARHPLWSATYTGLGRFLAKVKEIRRRHSYFLFLEQLLKSFDSAVDTPLSLSAFVATVAPEPGEALAAFGRNRLGLVLCDVRDMLLHKPAEERTGWTTADATPTELRIKHAEDARAQRQEELEEGEDDSEYDVNHALEKFEIICPTKPNASLSGFSGTIVKLDGTQYYCAFQYLLMRACQACRVQPKLWRCLVTIQDTETFWIAYKTFYKKLSDSQRKLLDAYYENEGPKTILTPLALVFAEYRNARDALLATEGKVIIDTTVDDPYWCIDIAAREFQAFIKEQPESEIDTLIDTIRRGQNLPRPLGKNAMGVVIMGVRDMLLEAFSGKDLALQDDARIRAFLLRKISQTSPYPVQPDLVYAGKGAKRAAAAPSTTTAGAADFWSTQAAASITDHRSSEGASMHHRSGSFDEDLSHLLVDDVVMKSPQRDAKPDREEGMQQRRFDWNDDDEPGEKKPRRSAGNASRSSSKERRRSKPQSESPSQRKKKPAAGGVRFATNVNVVQLEDDDDLETTIDRNRYVVPENSPPRNTRPSGISRYGDPPPGADFTSPNRASSSYIRPATGSDYYSAGPSSSYSGRSDPYNSSPSSSRPKPKVFEFDPYEDDGDDEDDLYAAYLKKRK